jgi:hypothetical protein
MSKGSEKFSYNLAASEEFFSIQDWRLMVFHQERPDPKS